MQYTDWNNYKWCTFWVHDSELGKNFPGIESKGKRKIMIYSANKKLSGKVLYLEMSSHAEVGHPETSVKVGERSWVLVNRIGMLKKDDVLNLDQSGTIQNKYKLEITKAFDTIYNGLLLDKVLELEQKTKI